MGLPWNSSPKLGQVGLTVCAQNNFTSLKANCRAFSISLCFETVKRAVQTYEYTLDFNFISKFLSKKLKVFSRLRQMLDLIPLFRCALWLDDGSSVKRQPFWERFVTGIHWTYVISFGKSFLVVWLSKSHSLCWCTRYVCQILKKYLSQFFCHWRDEIANANGANEVQSELYPK